MSEIKIYRIRDRETGLWSGGGSYPKFGKRGKTWDQFGHVTSHLASFVDYKGEIDRAGAAVYANAEIVEFILTEAIASVTDVTKILERKVREAKIDRAHGRYLSALVSQLEKTGGVETFRWGLVFQYTDKDAAQKWLSGEKLLKRGGHVRVGTAYAFSDRSIAAGIRLATPYAVAAFDLVEMVEGF